MRVERGPETRQPGGRYLLPGLLLLLMFAQILGGVTRTSLTIDEGLHITSGYTILRTGDYRLIEEHPPLVKFMAAWPLLLVPDLPDPRTLPGWEMDLSLTDSLRLVRVTQGLVYPYAPLDRLVFAARLPIALLALLLGVVAYRWSADRFGHRGGLLTLFLLTFDPNILAHAGVAATDLGAAFFILLALYTFWRALRRPTRRRWLLAGIALGLAQGAKLSALLLLPIEALLLLTAALHRPSRPTLYVSRLTFYTLLPASLVLWALYAFAFGPVPGASFDLSLPAPGHFIPWLRLQEHMRGGHAAFLMGRVSHHGWWTYFPVALAVKTPIPILLAWAGALFATLLARRDWRDDLVVWLFVALYLGLSLQSSLNIGYRHLLPILPLLAVAAGRLGRGLSRRWVQAAFAGLALWLVAGTVTLAPHYLAYFNELAGGPDGGYRWLVDSNTDWGQALKELARYQDEQGIEQLYLSMFTFLDPTLYGVRYEPLTPMHGDTPPVFPSRFNPPPGDYVISTTTLQGIPLVDPEMFDWFRHRTPDARIAHVMFHYHVPQPAQPGGWVAQCYVPVAPLSPQAIAEGFGRDDLRRAYFDCTQSWLVPAAGRSPGWYVLHRQASTDPDPFIQAQLAPLRLSYRQTRATSEPPFDIYEAATRSPDPPHPAGAPVRVGDLTFLGYARPAPLEIWTYWRVEALPDRPLSLMLHMVGPGGAPVIVADGLGVPVDNWQVGDIIIQRHRLDFPPDAPPGDYTAYTGVYWLDTLERWPVYKGEQPVGDQLDLLTWTK